MNPSPFLRTLDEQLEARTDLLSEAARQVPHLPPSEREELRARVLAFLREEIVSHTCADERWLYSRIGDRLGDPLAAAPMMWELRALRWWIDAIAHADVADTDELQRLLYGLHALIRVHLSREEDLYIAALESSSWPAD